MRTTLSKNGIDALSNGLNSMLRAWGQTQLNQANAETNRLTKGAAVQRALAGVDNLNARTAIAKQKLDATQAVLDALRGIGLDDRGVRNEMITAVNGKAYMPNAAVGNTGAVLDRATGQMVVDRQNPLTQAFMGVNDALIRQRRSAADVNAARQALLADRKENPARYLAGTYKQGTGSGSKPNVALLRLLGNRPVIGADGKPMTDLMSGRPITAFNPDALGAVFRELDGRGLPRTDDNILNAALGLLPKGGNSALSQAAGAAVPSIPVEPVQPVADPVPQTIDQANPRASIIQQVREQVRSGKLTKEQAMAALAEQGITEY